MTIDQLIAALAELKEAHGGDVDVTVWQYGGGLDDLCDVTPVFDSTDTGTVVLETKYHASGARR
jgi:hypothetical protein